MYLTLYTLFFILLCYLSAYTLSKVADHFQIRRKIAVAMMILSVVIIGFIYKCYHLYAVNRLPAEGELYRVENADFTFHFQKDGSAKVEQVIKLCKNRVESTAENRIIRYSIYEPNLSDPIVEIDGQRLENNSLPKSGYYEMHLEKEKNLFVIHPPAPENKELELRITYSAADLFVKDENTSVSFCRSFLTERNEFSYNTNFKGTLVFRLPPNSRVNFGGYSEHLYVTKQANTPDSATLRFENRLPYEKHPFTRFHDAIRRYDPFSSWIKRYEKDFALTVRLDFFPTDDRDLPIHSLSRNSHSVRKLNALAEENNKNYSVLLFLWGFFVTAWKYGNFFFLFLTLPLLLSFHKRRKEQEIFTRFDDET